MRMRRLLMTVCVVGPLSVLGCGGPRVPSDAVAIERCLPAEIPQLGLVRDGEIMRFAGDSLFNYIDGAAEMYHKYDFVEVQVGKYRKQGAGITADIYRFASDDLAFGMYSTLRPEDPDAVDLGAEGFTFGPVLIFTRGPFMVNVQTYDETAFSPSDIEALAAAVNKNLTGSTTKPATFRLFPDAGRVPNSEKMIAEAFLGRGFLKNVYTVEYVLDGGGATYFLLDDHSWAKFATWLDIASPRDVVIRVPSDLAYDEGMAAILEEKYYGSIIAGIIDGRLAGIVGYRPEYEQALRQWLKSLAAGS